MKRISNNCKLNINKRIFEDAEKSYSISVRAEIKEFLENNSGGYPVKDVIVSDGEEYEVNKQNIAVIKAEVEAESFYRVEFEKEEDTGLIYRVVINKK